MLSKKNNFLVDKLGTSSLSNPYVNTSDCRKKETLHIASYENAIRDDNLDGQNATSSQIDFN
jgi:hypothetical protein